MFRQDGRVLGSYLRKPGTLFSRRNQSIRYEFVKMMQDVGAVRKDVDPKVTAHIMDMLAYGLVSVGEVKDPEKSSHCRHYRRNRRYNGQGANA